MTTLIKPTLSVLFGQPDQLSTSFQTTQLTRALRQWLEVGELRVARKPGRYTRFRRLFYNYLKPLIFRPRSDFLLYANDGFADLDHWPMKRLLYWYDAPKDWVADPPRRSEWAQWLRFRNLTSADFVFAVSHQQVKMARQLRPGRESSVCYLPVGVDCKVFDPARADVSQVRKQFQLPEKTTIGYLGYLAWWEGRFAGEALLEIAAQLTAENDVHFLIVGFGPALPHFKNRVAELGLADRFTFTGYVADELVPGCIAAMDICVNTLEPGFHSQARSETKLKQYMAMGRACVATGLGENRVDLAEGNCGVLVDPGAGNLLRGIASVCDQPELRETLGKAARQRAMAVYNWPILAERMAAAIGVTAIKQITEDKHQASG